MALTLFPSILPNSDEPNRATDALIADALDSGACPWCESEADYANVGAHASQAHPEEWAAYKSRDTED